MAELQPSHVLVTGAEGLVGTAVVARLLAYGHPVTTLSLPDALVHPDVRVVRGDATDAETVGRAVEGVDAVIHLAAFPSPGGRPAPVTFGNNALATFTVLWTAAEAGVRRFAVASSVNAIGLLMNPKHPLPDRFPLDENTPTSIADPYSLSKQVDEHTLRAVCERFEASGVALRLPLVVPPQRHRIAAAGARARRQRCRRGMGVDQVLGFTPRFDEAGVPGEPDRPAGAPYSAASARDTSAS